MLRKPKSKKSNVWKYRLPMVLFIAFVLNFNAASIAQSPGVDKVIIGQNVLKFVVTKNTKDKQLESIKEKLSEKKATVTFNDVKRNEKHEITAINIDYSHAGSNGNFFVNSENPIADIAIALNVNENTLTVGQASVKLSQSFEVINEDGDTKLKKPRNEPNVFVYTTDGDGEKVETERKVVVIGKDGEEHTVKKEKKTYIIKSDVSKTSNPEKETVFVKTSKKDTVWVNEDVKNIVWTDDEGNDVEIITVEKVKNNIQIFTDKDEKPMILLDGKEIDKKDMEKLDPETIEDVRILKSEESVKKYGKKAKDGIIIITTKKKE